MIGSNSSNSNSNSSSSSSSSSSSGSSGREGLKLAPTTLRLAQRRLSTYQLYGLSRSDIEKGTNQYYHHLLDDNIAIKIPAITTTTTTTTTTPTTTTTTTTSFTSTRFEPIRDDGAVFNPYDV